MLVDENMTHIYFKDDNIFANDINVWNITSSMNLLSIGLIGESFKLIHFLIPGHDMGSVFPIFFFFSVNVLETDRLCMLKVDFKVSFDRGGIRGVEEGGEDSGSGGGGGVLT